MYVLLRLAGWPTYCVVLLVLAHIREPMAILANRWLPVVHNYFYRKEVLRLYSSFRYLCSGNCVCVCLRQAGWRTYYAVPLVLVDDVVQFIPRMTFPFMAYERRRRSCT